MNRNILPVALGVALSVCGGVIEGSIILPGIQGTVYQDADLNGGASPGEGVAGATLRLYLDDGDGVFNPSSGDSQVGADLLSAADGSYQFDTLDPDARYFVQRADFTLGSSFLPAAVSSLLNPGQVSLVIDEFENNQVVWANPATPIGTSTYSDPLSNVIGHERDLYVRKVGGIGEVELRSNAFGVTVLQYDNTAGVVGQAIVTWDGIDMSASPTPSLGLGDVDLTGGGANEGLLLRLGVDATGASETVRILLYDDDSTVYSSASSAIPVTGGTATAVAYIPFSDFVGPVSPAKVNAIQLLLGEGAKSVDAQLDILGAVAPVTQDFPLVPEPSTGTLLLLGAVAVWRRRSR